MDGEEKTQWLKYLNETPNQSINSPKMEKPYLKITFFPIVIFYNGYILHRDNTQGVSF